MYDRQSKAPLGHKLFKGESTAEESRPTIVLKQNPGHNLKRSGVLFQIQPIHQGYDAQSERRQQRSQDQPETFIIILFLVFVTNIVIIGCRACQRELFLFNQRTNKKLSTTEQSKTRYFQLSQRHNQMKQKEKLKKFNNPTATTFCNKIEKTTI